MLPEQIAKSISNVGGEETALIMARALCYMANTSNNDYEFYCDIGTVTIERKKIVPND